jgi:hypothetical protein
LERYQAVVPIGDNDQSREYQDSSNDEAFPILKEPGSLFSWLGVLRKIGRNAVGSSANEDVSGAGAGAEVEIQVAGAARRGRGKGTAWCDTC